MTAKAIAYDLGIAVSSIALWLTPVDALRAIGYATSIVFSGRAYYTGVTLLAKERREDEIEAMQYDATIDFHERLLESTLELKLQQLENRFTEYLIPLARRKHQLEQQLAKALPHPELSEEDKEEAAKRAVEDAFTESHSYETEFRGSVRVSEEDIRKQFPEQLDSTTWKAVSKAIANGASREEILVQVLQSNNDIGKAYLDLLKQKYL